MKYTLAILIMLYSLVCTLDLILTWLSVNGVYSSHTNDVIFSGLCSRPHIDLIVSCVSKSSGVMILPGAYSYATPLAKNAKIRGKHPEWCAICKIKRNNMHWLMTNMEQMVMSWLVQYLTMLLQWWYHYDQNAHCHKMKLQCSLFEHVIYTCLHDVQCNPLRNRWHIQISQMWQNPS